MPEDVLSVNTELRYSTDGFATDDNLVAHVTSLDGPGISGTDIGTTDYDITDNYKTFTAGNVDPGEITATVKYDPTEFATHYANVRTEMDFKIVFNDFPGGTDSELSGKGYIRDLGIAFEDAEDDGLVTNELTIKCSGKWTFTAGSA